MFCTNPCYKLHHIVQNCISVNVEIGQRTFARVLVAIHMHAVTYKLCFIMLLNACTLNDVYFHNLTVCLLTFNPSKQLVLFTDRMREL